MADNMYEERKIEYDIRSEEAEEEDTKEGAERYGTHVPPTVSPYRLPVRTELNCFAVLQSRFPNAI
jgi:hypothetical protein